MGGAAAVGRRGVWRARAACSVRVCRTSCRPWGGRGVGAGVCTGSVSFTGGVHSRVKGCVKGRVERRAGCTCKNPLRPPSSSSRSSTEKAHDAAGKTSSGNATRSMPMAAADAPAAGATAPPTPAAAGGLRVRRKSRTSASHTTSHRPPSETATHAIFV